jgi:hypothetical protein
VFTSFEFVRLHAARTFPFAVSAAFLTATGSERVWTVFAGPSTAGLFVMPQPPGTWYETVDIDADGILDVKKFQRVFEQDIGDETYVSWYRWNGAAFSHNGTVSTVRTLVNLFKTCDYQLVRGQWNDFCATAMEYQTRMDMLSRGMNLERILSRVFRSASGRFPFVRGSAGGEAAIASVTFPEILENPFVKIGDRYVFSFTVRVDAKGGGSSFYNATVYMLPNPFSGRVLAFGSD